MAAKVIDAAVTPGVLEKVSRRSPKAKAQVIMPHFAIPFFIVSTK